MKKYKCIKKYPWGPELETIIRADVTSLYENYPEYWEEVIEKDYEILSFKEGLRIWYKVTDGNYTQYPEREHGTFTEKYALEESKTYSIHSIKRLSDGEIFTIGDKLECEIPTKSIFKLDKIKLRNNQIYFICNHGGNVYQSHYWLHQVSHFKQHLFTTEDGVNINVGDEYFELIIPGFHNKECVWNIIPNIGRSNLIYDQEGNRKHFRLWFSTKEKAEEYIIENKPCLSLNDVKKLDLGLGTQWLRHKLKQLVEERIK